MRILTAAIPFCGTVLAALFLAAPAHAQWERLTPVTEAPMLAQAAPDLDEDGCLALSKTMDAKEKRKEKPTAKEQSDYEDCVGWFSCEQAKTGWDAATRTNEMLLRHVMTACGHKGTE